MKITSVTDAILLDEAIRKNVAAAERKLKGLPWNHPQRIWLELDQEIVRNNSHFNSDDTENAVGLIRQMETAAPGPPSTGQANAKVYDELTAVVKRSVEDASVMGLNRNALKVEDFEKWTREPKAEG